MIIDGNKMRKSQKFGATPQSCSDALMVNSYAIGRMLFRLSIFPPSARAISLTFKYGGAALFVQPLEKFLKVSVGKNRFHGIKRVAKFVVTPGFVDEILAGMARGHDLGPVFATRNNVMPTRGNGSLTEYAF